MFNRGTRGRFLRKAVPRQGGGGVVNEDLLTPLAPRVHMAAAT